MLSRKMPKSAQYTLMHLDFKYSKLHTKKILLFLLLYFQSTFRLNLMCTGPILDIEDMISFLVGYFLEKMAFWFLASPKRMPFLTISDKNIFFKTQATRSGAIVTPNKCLEQALCVYDSVKFFVLFLKIAFNFFGLLLFLKLRFY